MCKGSCSPGRSTTCKGNRGIRPCCMLLLWRSSAAPCPLAAALRSMLLKLKRTPGIYLVGFMGCGKSTVGRALADELGWYFSDLDEDIEQGAGTTIAQIFDTRGEAAFREMETESLRKRIHTV